jgi:hypothetical protein
VISPATTPDLPRDLAAWRQELEFLPHDLALSLQGPLRRLRGLLGALATPALGAGGEPDGYQDLARRGPYERLVASEWLLADEVPEEFDRRAAMGEHLFLELAHRSPRPRGRSLALFDAGPDQLGAPRVAQLALLILLAGRARAGGTAFLWGLVQHPATGLVAEVTKETIRGFLEGRSAEPVRAQHLDVWRPLLGEPGAADDLWLVGGERLTSRAREIGASALTIDDPLVPNQRALQVRADRPGVRPRTVELDLPVEAACVRLLRDPFAIAVAEPSRVDARPDVGAGLVFSAGGHRLLVRQAGGGLVAYHVPNSAREKTGRPQRLQPSTGDELVAGGFRHGMLLAATLSGHALTLHGVPWPGVGRAGGKLVIGLPPDVTVTAAGEGAPLGVCHYAPQGRSRRSAVAVVDGAGCAFEAAPGHFARLGRWARVVAAEATFPVAMLIVEEEGRQPGATPWAAVTWGGPETATTVHSGLSSAAELTPVFGHPRGVFAVASAPGQWQVIAGQTERELHPGSGCRPVAVSCAAGGPSLVILEDDRRTFSLAGRHSSNVLVRSEREVAAAVGCRARPIFAFMTTAGELLAYSLLTRTTIFRAWPMGGA